MARKMNVEKAIRLLREVEVLQGQGKTIAEACRTVKVTQNTYYRYKREFGGLDLSQAKRLKGLESENSRLKKLVADLSLDNAILKEVSSGNF